MKYLIGNWKSNFTADETTRWIDVAKKTFPSIPDKLTVVLCPSFQHLLLFKLNFPNLILGSQTISPFPNGAYTGAVSASSLKNIIEYCIVGHSERRTYFKESNSDVSNQITQLVDNDITPIIAVDSENWFSQLSILGEQEISKSIIMYEPPDAISLPVGPIGQGSAAPINEVVLVIEKIKAEFQAKAVIYGGSVKSHNIAEYLSHPEIDGVLPGSASLNPEEWIAMIKLATQSIINGH